MEIYQQLLLLIEQHKDEQPDLVILGSNTHKELMYYVISNNLHKEGQNLLKEFMGMELVRSTIPEQMALERKQ
jgi:hypothetical protein